MNYDLDVFIPTLKKRTNGLLCNVHTVLNSGVNVRVTVSIPDDNYPEFMDALTDKEKSCVRIINNVPQGDPSIPIEYCLENIEWTEWVYIVADDDCVLPWGLAHLMSARQGMSLVMGQAIGVSRIRHFDFSSWKIGIDVVEGHVNAAMFNYNTLKKMKKPWFTNHPCCDYLLIKKMTDLYPYRIIPNVVHVSAFAELENLTEEFQNEFMSTYRNLL